MMKVEGYILLRVLDDAGVVQRRPLAVLLLVYVFPGGRKVALYVVVFG